MEAQVSRAPLRLFFLCFFPALFRFVYTEAAPTLVTSLPGFDGALPFRLETGYVNVDEENGAELFYYFIESEGDPRRDPVVLWLTGGDRCSVLSALFFEIGPLKFIIEPYNQNGTVPRLRLLSSLQLKLFLTKWFAQHPDYLSNPFYLGGDSYAGKLVPFLAQKVSEDIEAGLRPVINLKGYLVGNPVTGEDNVYTSRVPFLHGMGIISDQLYETIKENCQAADYVNAKNVLCVQAMAKFNRLFDEITHPHVLYKKCAYVSPRPNDQTSERKILKEETGVLKRPPPRPAMDCQIYGNYLSYFWANSNITRETLGIKKGSKDEWVRCHEGDLPYSLDIKSSIKYHHNMTTRGYRALVYSGDHDAVIPFLGTQSWVRSLNFPIVDEWRAWHLDGQSAGFTITYTNNLTFATIKGGGHTAPEYQPERCLAMFSLWIFGEPL
ncbi:unnamed protein product [Alopecurus aequalis]